MARPHPVVGVAAEFADRRRRSRNEPHVVELFIDEKELLIAVIHLFDGCAVTSALFGLLADRLFCLSGGQTVGYLLHADEKPHP